MVFGRSVDAVPLGRYLLLEKAEAKLLEEKADKLFGICRLLDRHLVRDFAALLKKRRIRVTDREAAIRVLEQELGGFCDMVAAGFPGVGTGYYCAELDAIVTYAPSRMFGDKVGVRVDASHIGKQSMRERREMVGVGSMVRGEIMNAVRPIIRNDQPIGFIWANETVEDIYKQMHREAGKVFFSSNIQPLMGIAGMILFASESVARMSRQPPPWPGNLGTPSPVEGNPSGPDFHASVARFQRYLRLFLDSVPVGVIIANYAGTVVFINRGLQELAGGDLKKLEGKQLDRAVDALGLCMEGRRLQFGPGDSRPDAQDYEFERLQMKTFDGQLLEVNAIYGTVRDSENLPVGFVLVMEDLKRASEEEERVRRAEKLAAVGELAAAVAHEMRNPIGILAGSIQLIPQKLRDEAVLREFARVATEEMCRLNKTLDSLLKFARASEPQLAPQDLNALAREAVEFIRTYAEGQGVSLVEEYCPGLPRVIADPEHLRQAFLNLLINAIQAMPSGGTLTVKTRSVGGNYVQASFRDTGVGIDPKHHRSIFDPFFSTRGSSGLGLALVHRIVDEHGGYVSFESSPGEGSVFYVNLPASADKAQLALENGRKDNGRI